MSWPDAPNDALLGDGLYGSRRIRPADLDELRGAVADAARDGWAVYPQGGRTALGHGGAPSRPGVALDTTALDRVLDYPAGDMTVTVEAGMTLATMRRLLAEQGQRLLVEATDAESATLGAIFAVDASGPRRAAFGRCRDQVLGVRFVTAEGTVVKGGGRVVKNVAGYDFPRLLTGSLGTLGVIVELTLRVRPRPEAAAVCWWGFEERDDLARAMETLYLSATRPVTVELLNAAALEAIRSNVAAAPSTPYALLIGFEENPTAVAWQVEAIGRELGRAPEGVARDAEAERAWEALVAAPSRAPGRVAIKAALRPTAVVPFVAELDPGRWAVQASAASGIVRAARREDEPEAVSDVQPEVDRLRGVAASAGGRLTLSRCPTEWKERLRVWGDPTPDWTLMRGIKRALDPGDVLNPGRLFGGD